MMSELVRSSYHPVGRPDLAVIWEADNGRPAAYEHFMVRLPRMVDSMPFPKRILWRIRVARAQRKFIADLSRSRNPENLYRVFP